MNTDERRAFKKFENEYTIHIDPEKWKKVKIKFVKQRTNIHTTVDEVTTELIAFLIRERIGFELKNLQKKRRIL